MRRRFTRRPKGASFRRRRRVEWLTHGQLQGQELLTARTDRESGSPEYWILQPPENDFVANHPRFAKANDVVTVRRIVGKCRIGYYRTDNSINQTDYQVDYGLCFIKGDYDESGTWTIKDTPDPSDTGDEEDKWLFKNTVFLSTGQTFVLSYQDIVYNLGTGIDLIQTTGGSSFAGSGLSFLQFPLRQVMMSTDGDLPNGSYVDIKTRRRLEYGERLHLVTSVIGEADTAASFYANWKVRMLTSKWT